MYIHMYIFFSGVVRRLRSLHTKGECYCYLQAHDKHDKQVVGWPRKTQHWRGVGRVLSPTFFHIKNNSEINKINIKKVLGTTTLFLTNWDFFFFLLAQIANNSASNFRRKKRCYVPDLVSIKTTSHLFHPHPFTWPNPDSAKVLLL